MEDISHISDYLLLLPSGPDKIHRLTLNILHTKTNLILIPFVLYTYFLCIASGFLQYFSIVHYNIKYISFFEKH